MSSKRPLIAGSAVLTHLCLGSVYAWSIFIPSLQRQAGWSRPQLTWAFALAIACLGLTAALSAPLVGRIGPKASVRLAAGFFGLGLAGAGMAAQFRALWLLYLSYGVVGGIGLGLGYVPPVTTLMRWFEDRKGLATGLAVGGFGLGALMASFLGEALLHCLPCGRVFVVLGLGYGTLILAASTFLDLPANPPQHPPAAQGLHALREPKFWVLWSAFFLNIAAGILLIALARPILEDAGRSLAAELVTPVAAVAIMGLFNGLGRLGWSALSDRLGRTRTWILMFLVQAVAFLVLRGATRSPATLAPGLWLVATCYGGGFAICPAFVADTFGAARAPRIYGLTLTAWGAAALVGPPVAAWMREAFGTYSATLGACAIASILGLLLITLLHRLQRSGNKAGLALRAASIHSS